jgi:DNA polymerase (family 10)
VLDALPPAERGAMVKRARDEQAQVAALPETTLAIIRHLVNEGARTVVDAELARIPRDLARLLAAPGVRPLDVLDVHDRFGAVTAGDLAAAVMLAGSESTDAEQAATYERLRAHLPGLRLGHPRMPLGHAWSVVEEVQRAIGGDTAGDVTLTPVGSLRRFEPTVGDVELLGATDAASAFLDAAVGALPLAEVTHRSAGIATFVVRGEQVTVRTVSPEQHAASLLYYTGSAGHVRALQARAEARGWRLGPTGLTDREGHLIAVARDEAALYEALGLGFIPPELRAGGDEVERAAAGALPALLRPRDIRGDLHVHTLWSDGRDSVEAVAVAARELGYEYVAITDHSPSAAASRVLTLERLQRQAEEVAVARERVPQVAILHGVEADILPDGRLDLPDTVLAGLDIVLASLHDAAGHDPDTLLSRYTSAMRHPLVTLVTHPANRLVGRHDGYALDYERLFAIAVETGTALEIDGGPAHLDLDGALAARAVAAGVTLGVDSDCHNVARLGRQMLFGVGTARRGGIEARHVLNTRPLADVKAFIATKRGSR